jgi:hypothetical protein
MANQNDGGGRSRSNYRQKGHGGSFAPTGKKGRSANIASARPVPASPPPPVPYPGAGGGGGGSYDFAPMGGGGMGGGQALSAPAPQMSEADWLAGDQSYIRQMAALKAAMENFTADQGAQTTRYNTDFNTGLSQLGFSGRPDAAGSDPFTTEGGMWNETDQNTASGRAFSNQLNDFASRGVLQSSLFGKARNDLQRSLNDQLNSVVSGRTNFLDDLMRQKTAYQQENESAGRSAREEALARMAASIGI